MLANFYQVDLDFMAYVLVVVTAVLSSVGTAGVPGIGMVTLAMVLTQVGIPIEGIAMIQGVDRLLDMARTVVNITGDAVIACVVAESEGALDRRCLLATGSDPHSINTSS